MLKDLSSFIKLSSKWTCSCTAYVGTFHLDSSSVVANVLTSCAVSTVFIRIVAAATINFSLT